MASMHAEEMSSSRERERRLGNQHAATKSISNLCFFFPPRVIFLSMLSTMPFLPSFIPLAVRIQPSKGVRNERAGNRWPPFYDSPRSSLFKTPPTHALSANKLLMMPHKHGPFYEFLGSFLLFNTLPPHLPMPYQQTSCS